jgi:hypothetical protein
MLDNLGILVSSVMILIVIVRAAQLDSRNPWFERFPDSNTPPNGRTNTARHIPAWRRPKH